MPLVHTTQAYHIKHIVAANEIQTTRCTVFTADSLNYFFVGRPAYKFEGDSEEAQYWELPCCFIFDFGTIPSPKRVFPFDSGAFHHRLYPRYISKMSLGEFEVSGAAGEVGRLVGAFFGDVRSYFNLQPKDKLAFEREFSLGAFDEEIRALHTLASHGPAKSFDDRRFAIEVQSDTSVQLGTSRPLAVVAPSVYFDDSQFRQHVETTWNAQPISYPIFNLSVSRYYALIYERVEAYYKSNGLL